MALGSRHLRDTTHVTLKTRVLSVGRRRATRCFAGVVVAAALAGTPVTAAEAASSFGAPGASLVSTVLLGGRLAPVSQASTRARAPSTVTDPIVGDWDRTSGGAPAVATMTLSAGVYTEKAKTPWRVEGASCDVPPGTTIATFQKVGIRAYAGQHELWYLSNCSFDKWASMTLTLSTDGTTLTERFYNESSVLTKVAVIPSQGSVNGFSATTAKDPYSVAERQMLAEIPARAVLPASASPVCTLQAAAANQVNNSTGLLIIWTIAPSAQFIHEASAQRLVGAQLADTYLAGLLKKSKSLYLAALQADRVPVQGSAGLDSWWGVEVRSISTTGGLMTFQIAATATTSTITWSNVSGVSSSASQAMAPEALANLLYYSKSIAVLTGSTT